VFGRAQDDQAEARTLDRRHYNGNTLRDSGIEALPKIEYDVSREHEMNHCLICKDDFENGDSLILLPCFHYYHAECGGKWLGVKAECPSCKHKV
jgi:hypothetical protein